MTAPDRPSASHITDAELDALFARLDAHDRAPALRGCLVPGCRAQYDARAALTGEPPARPEWSAGGWRTVGCGGVLPAGGHVCPEHGGLVAAHLPRAVAQRDPIAVGADCSCGRYVTDLYRWHGAAAALWQDHLLREAEAQQAQEHACTPAGAPNSRNGSTGTGETERGSETHSHARTNHKETPPCPNRREAGPAGEAGGAPAAGVHPPGFGPFHVDGEYGWRHGHDPDDQAPDVTLAWAPDPLDDTYWRLLADGADTGVRLCLTLLYTPEVTP